MENLQYLILQEIYLRHSNRSGTSLNVFIEKLKRRPSDIEFTKDIKIILLDLEAREIVTWKAEPMTSKGGNFPDSDDFKRKLGTSDSSVNQTFENIYVEVQLTHEGYDYARDMFDREVIRESTLSVNKWMKILTSILTITAALTLIVQVKQCDISSDQLQNDLIEKNRKTDSDASANSKEKRETVLIAVREASLGGIRLNLYSDKTFDLGTLRKIRWTGIYLVKNDTLCISAADSLVTSFVISDSTLLEIKNKWTKINFLEIQENKLSAR